MVFKGTVDKIWRCDGMTNSENVLDIPGFATRVIRREDLPDLQQLLERCADYSIMASGSPPASNAAVRLLEECPDGKTADDKLVLGIYNTQNDIVGVLDAISDYPEPGAWWLGLLLIDPAYRNQGLGRQVYLAFEAMVIQLRGSGICLGVVEENEKAFRFWRSLGFEVYARQLPRQIGILRHVVVVMAHKLEL